MIDVTAFIEAGLAYRERIQQVLQAVARSPALQRALRQSCFPAGSDAGATEQSGTSRSTGQTGSRGRKRRRIAPRNRLELDRPGPAPGDIEIEQTPLSADQSRPRASDISASLGTYSGPALMSDAVFRWLSTSEIGDVDKRPDPSTEEILAQRESRSAHCFLVKGGDCQRHLQL